MHKDTGTRPRSANAKGVPSNRTASHPIADMRAQGAFRISAPARRPRRLIDNLGDQLAVDGIFVRMHRRSHPRTGQLAKVPNDVPAAWTTRMQHRQLPQVVPLPKLVRRKRLCIKPAAFQASGRAFPVLKELAPALRFFKMFVHGHTL